MTIAVSPKVGHDQEAAGSQVMHGGDSLLTCYGPALAVAPLRRFAKVSS